MPARMISAVYAEYDSTSVTVPQISGLAHSRDKPSAGTPNPIRNTSRITGMPRSTSV
jgi:hypothetical protein